MSKPSYLRLAETGELAARAERALERLQRCVFCGRACAADRLNTSPGAWGPCATGRYAAVASYGPHFGEELPLRGWRGSGTIFFSQCNLQCIFCQNYDVSILGQGTPATDEDVARTMLALQNAGCHNINFVSPSHVVPQILHAVAIAAAHGLRLPLVYNTGGYDSMPALRLLDGVIDIYMPDLKYADDAVAERLSGIPHYRRVNRRAVREMHRQVGDLRLDERGLAVRGMLIRHLVLPNGLAGTPDVLQFVAEELSPDSYVNIMDQYRPAFRAPEEPTLRRPLTSAEYDTAVACARSVGLHRGDWCDWQAGLTANVDAAV
ncbi:MAG: radical SAM protein [Dehalococcoidia bacterium]|nr:radical SAM protein [Dehalococcoidia bacterium]